MMAKVVDRRAREVDPRSGRKRLKLVRVARGHHAFVHDDVVEQREEMLLRREHVERLPWNTTCKRAVREVLGQIAVAGRSEVDEQNARLAVRPQHRHFSLHAVLARAA